ncbi:MULTISPECIES: hypothetical protein [Brevibacterium]|uniref:Uncharacterized protein n=2 Tax=Brevibacterium TaxID=1696 RepID=A0ABP9U8B9_9MICO
MKNGSAYFTTATALTMIALLGFMVAGFVPIAAEVAFGVEALAVFLALTGVVILALVTIRKALEKAGSDH